MAIVTEYDWETNSWTHHTESAVADDTMAEHAEWLQGLQLAYERACAALPEHVARIDLAKALVEEGAIYPQSDGSYLVTSQSLGSKTKYRVNHRCECPGYGKARPHGLCKHRLAVRLYQRSHEYAGEGSLQEPTGTDAIELPSQDTPTPPEVDTGSTQGIPEVLRPYLMLVHGKPFVRYAGLLALAHERGLVSLAAKIEFHSDVLVLASATATFSDGRSYSEWADAMPDNVGFQVRPHWIRMALTRAKARALRDALQIGIAALEELADTE